MKNPLLKKILPHTIAFIIFLLSSVFFCNPVLEGKVLNQHDIISWKGMVQGSLEYKEKNGHLPLWNVNLFSGMPNYQVGMEGKNFMPDLNKIFSLNLPKPMNYFFLACLWFYILTVVLNIKPVIGIISSLAFSYGTYIPIIIGAGHETKMLAIIYMPALIGGLLLIFQKKYWLGLALGAFAAYYEIGSNHIQITFYLALVIVAMTISYIIKWIKQKEWKHLLIAGSLSLLVGFIGIAGSALLLMTNYEYAKSTMRGGGNIEISGDSVINKKTTGLNKDYAFQYSLAKMETFVLLMPEAFGGSSGKTYTDESKVVTKLSEKGMPENQAIQIAEGLPKYWGGIDGAGTSGPPYLGALICLLALIGFVIIDHPLKWGFLAASVFGIMISWGKYFEGFNTIIFNYMPLYSKFRAPSMALIITQLVFPITAALCLQKIFYSDLTKEQLKAIFKKTLYIIGGLIVFLGLCYIAMDYSSWIDAEILKNKDENGNNDVAKIIVSALKGERQSMFGTQILRTFAFAALLIGILYFNLQNKIKSFLAIAILGLVCIADLFIVGKGYLNENFYVDPEEYVNTNFTPDNVDKEILTDKTPQCRVYNLSPDRFSDPKTSYFHRSIGGYHPAKLKIYQDVIGLYLSSGTNINILNMLNAKYIIMQDQQTGKRMLQKNETALGPCWFTKHVSIVNGPLEEIKAIRNTNPRDTVFIDSSYKSFLTSTNFSDSLATINLTKFDNDFLEYNTNASSNQFATFSEIYYPYGWNVYLDGKKTDYIKVNYLLRGMVVPAGKHTILFKFEPQSFINGNRISYAISILIPILFLICGIMIWLKKKKEG